jgi:hypothetical protein
MTTTVPMLDTRPLQRAQSQWRPKMKKLLLATV